MIFEELENTVCPECLESVVDIPLHWLASDRWILQEGRWHHFHGKRLVGSRVRRYDDARKRQERIMEAHMNQKKKGKGKGCGK